jgi:hypothetical protein
VGGGWQPMHDYLVHHSSGRFQNRSRSEFEEEAVQAVQAYRNEAGIGLSKPVTPVAFCTRKECTQRTTTTHFILFSFFFFFLPFPFIAFFPPIVSGYALSACLIQAQGCTRPAVGGLGDWCA